MENRGNIAAGVLWEYRTFYYNVFDVDVVVAAPMNLTNKQIISII